MIEKIKQLIAGLLENLFGSKPQSILEQYYDEDDNDEYTGFEHEDWW